jgi:hypothetical protein
MATIDYGKGTKEPADASAQERGYSSREFLAYEERPGDRTSGRNATTPTRRRGAKLLAPGTPPGSGLPKQLPRRGTASRPPPWS